MLRILCQFIGLGFCIIGLLGMLTPIPFGLIFFIIGLMFLVPTSPTATRTVRWARRRVPFFDSVMQSATRRAPLPYKRVLRQTENQDF